MEKGKLQDQSVLLCYEYLMCILSTEKQAFFPKGQCHSDRWTVIIKEGFET